MSYAIQAEGLVKRFGKTTALAGVDLAVRTGRVLGILGPNGAGKTTALAGVDLAVRTGRVLGILGPNGAGKTTAVRILSTLIRPDEGRATVGGYDVVHQPQQVRQLIGLTGQYASVDEELTGFENLLLIGRLQELPRKLAKQRAHELLARFELTDAGGRPASTYSGGMRRRLDLAASLVGHPKMLYLDEPTTGLDPHARNEVWEVIRNLVEDGTTVLLTTQYLEEADQLAHEIAVIDHGKVVASGTSAELKAKAGAQTLDIRPADLRDLPAVRTIMAELTGEQPTDGTDPGLLSVPVNDPDVLSAAVRRLDHEQITVRELALRLPSLDEVFLALTGHRAESETKQEGQAA